MKKLVTKGMVLAFGVYLMVLLQTTVFAADKTFADYFPDPVFAMEVARHLGKDVGSVVTQEELDQIVKLETDTWYSYVQSIEGVRYLRNLQSFELRSARLEVIPAEIGELSHLTSLDLDFNAIEEIPPEIGQLSQLTSLDLAYNAIVEIPPEIGELSQLTSLALPGNELEEISPEIGNLSQLTSLNLNYTTLEEIPPEISELSGLTSLSLYFNSIEEIPPEIGRLSQLTSLSLSYNAIEEIPSSIGELSQLTSLRMDANAIKKIPSEIGELSKLQELSLYGNEVEEIPAEIANLRALETLYLQNNQIEDWTAIGSLGNLSYLNLSDNQIRVIPDTIQNMTSLSELILSNNQIRVMPKEMGNLVNLATMSLENNQIEVMEDLEGLDKLYGLFLTNNKIKEIPESLGNLPELFTLDLSNNQIEVVPDNLSNVVFYDYGKESLDLSGNLIQELPDSFGNTRVVSVFLNRNQLTRLPDSFGTVQLGDSAFSIADQQVQLSPVSVQKGENITSVMLVPEIVVQLNQHMKEKYDEHNFGHWEIVTPNQQVITHEYQDGSEDMSELFQEPGDYEIRYVSDKRDFKYYHASMDGDITSSISLTVLPEQKTTHQVDVTVRYLDDARAEETKSYTVDEGEAFEQQVDVLNGYALANMGLFRAFFDFDYDTDRNVVSLSPVDADHSILLEFDKAQYRVRLKTTYVDGSQADSTQVSWIPFEEDYQQSYQIAEGYEIANLDQLDAAGYEVDETNKTVHIGAVTQNYDITLELRKKPCEVIVRVVYEDGAYPDQVSTYPVLYGESFNGAFSYDENYAIRKVSFNATGVSVDRIRRQINIGSVTGSIEITIVVR